MLTSYPNCHYNKTNIYGYIEFLALVIHLHLCISKISKSRRALNVFKLAKYTYNTLHQIQEREQISEETKTG